MGKRSRRSLYRRLVEELAIWERLDLSQKGIVVDYGCGDGWLARKLAIQGFRVVGVDVDKGFLDSARKILPPEGMSLVLYQGGVLPIRAESVDLVLAVGVVRSLLDRDPLEGAISEWRRCLRPRGRVLLIETDNTPLRRYMGIQQVPEALENWGFRKLAWYPIRRTSWWGLRLVKWGLLPPHLMSLLARWELSRRRLEPVQSKAKRAYLGEFERK
jgi:SAM-dependent methyltransferase